MKRLSTTFEIAAWAGYLVVVSSVMVLAVLKLAFTDVHEVPLLADEADRLAAWMLATGNAAILEAAVAAVWAAMTAAVLATALWLLHHRVAENRTLGDGVAHGSMGAIALFGAGAWMAGLPIPGGSGSTGTFAVLLGLSVLSIAFDRLIEVDDSDISDDEFKASAMLLGEGIARNALRTPARHRSDHGRGDR